MALDYVRAKVKDEGTHVSILRQELENNPDAYEELKQDAVNANGDPLPPAPPATSKTPAKKAATPRKRASKKAATQPPESPVASGQTATTPKKES